MNVSELAPMAIVLVLISGCSAPPAVPAEPAPSESTTATTSPPTPTKTPPPRLGSVKVPGVLTGEVARFWFSRPGDNKVAVGPFAVARQRLTVHGACYTFSGSAEWKVFDNSTDDEDVIILDSGRIRCDGAVTTAHADVGKHTEVGVLAVTDAVSGSDDGENAWIVLANE
jgi:hypothetical protein